MDKDLQVVLSSGDISGVNLGGTASTDAVLKKGDNDAIYQDLAGVNAVVKTQFTPTTTASSPTHSEGQMYYNSDNETMRIQGPFIDVEVSIGHGMHVHIENNSGGLIEKGSACRHNGVVAGKVQAVKAIATSFVEAEIFGVASADIIDGATGAITTFGEITALDTSLFNDGVPLYLSDTVAGEWVETAPSIISQVGGVTLTDALGTLFVSIINNKNLPTVFAGMQGQTVGNDTYAVTAVVQDIDDYLASTNVVMTSDLPTGVVTLSNDGNYRLHFSADISFPSGTGTRTVFIELYDATNTSIIYTYSKNIPKNATADGFSFQYPFAGTTADNYKMRIRSSGAIAVTFVDISFDIQSISIV